MNNKQGFISANLLDIPLNAFLLMLTTENARLRMKRLANPTLSASGEAALAQYRQVLWEQEDLASASRRNYLSDLRHFAALERGRRYFFNDNTDK